MPAPRASGLLVLALLGACSSPSPRRPDGPEGAPPGKSPPSRAGAKATPGAATVKATEAAAASASDPSGLCAPLLASHRIERSKIHIPEEYAGGSGSIGNMARPLDTLGFCTLTPGGAWAIVFDSVVVQPPEGGEHTPPDVAGTWSITHVTRGGAVALLTRTSSWDGYNATELSAPELFDYDGDGEPELFVLETKHAHEDASTYLSHLVTFRDGTIRPYAPAKDLEPRKVMDVDRDGRPDLLGFVPYVGVSEAPLSGFTYAVSGPELLAHALPDGSFSRSDAEAKAYIRRACPSRPNPIVPAKASPTDLIEREVGVNVVCARVWGMGPKEVVGALRKDCRPSDPSDARSSARALHGEDCGKRELLEKWAAIDPPVRLP